MITNTVEADMLIPIDYDKLLEIILILKKLILNSD
jgi:hypothetical protein